MSEPNHVICRYQVRKDKEQDFRALLDKHWPTLRELDLVTDDPPLVFRGEDKEGALFYVEIFEWKEGGMKKAHELPQVMAVWEPMGACLDAMEFPHVEPQSLPLA